MKASYWVLITALVLACSLGSPAQDYKPFIPVCVVDGGEIRPGMTARYAYEGQWYVVGFCSSACRIKFLQSPAACMKAALEAKASATTKKEKKVSSNATGPCDLKRVVKTPWCPSCNRELGKDDVRNNLCKKCETKAVQAEFCVKGRATEDRARVSYKCESCGASAELESEFKHEPDCKAKLGSGLKKVCSKSGTAPHATEAK
jgi:hypothetical protein